MDSHDAELIFIPSEMRAWPLAHVEFDVRAHNALARAGVVTLGDLHERPWSFIWQLRGVGSGTAKKMGARLMATVSGGVAPPPPGPVPPPAGMPRASEILDWLLGATRPRQLIAAIRVRGDRATYESLGREWSIGRERVRQLVETGMLKAKNHLRLVPAWPAILRSATNVIDELTVVTAEGLYRHVANDVGWEYPPEIRDLHALRALLALSGDIVVMRRGEMAAFCRSEKHAWARIAWLEKVPPTTITDVGLTLPTPVGDTFVRDVTPLLELGGRRKPYGITVICLYVDMVHVLFS